MNDAYRLSVIIPTYRRGEHLLETLESVTRWLGPRDELLIVDQLPDHAPGVQQRIENWTRDSRVRLWQLPEASLTLARNFGGLMARAPVMVYLDDDVTIMPGFFEGHLALYQSDEVQAVAGHVNNNGVPYWPKETERNLRFQECAVGCNMSVRRSAFVRVGGFDLNFQGNYRGEENEFLERVRFAGGRIANGKDCPLNHRAAVRGGCENRTHDDRWARFSLQNHLYWMLKRSLPKKLRHTYTHIYYKVMRDLPRRQLVRPSFWKKAVLPAVTTAIRLAIFGAKPPFWPSPELLATPPVVRDRAGRGADQRACPTAPLEAA